MIDLGIDGGGAQGTMPEQVGDGFGVFQRRVASDGSTSGPEMQVNNTYTAGNQWSALVTTTGDDGFVVVWASDSGEDPNQLWNIRARRFDASGIALGDEVGVASGTVGIPGVPAVASHWNGNMMVVWPQYYQGNGPIDGDGHGILGRTLGSDLTPLNPPFQVNTYTTGNQVDPHVASVEDGFAVVWSSFAVLGDADIRAQDFGATGRAVGPELQINTYTTGDQSRPAVACRAGTQECVVMWEGAGADDSQGVFGRRLTLGAQVPIALPAPTSTPTPTPTPDAHPTATATPTPTP
jgi:trimeric autotransporter adhesin